MNYFKSLVVFSVILFSANLTFAQFDKSTCEAAISEIDIAECHFVKVITDIVGTSDVSANNIMFENKSVEFFYMEKYLKVKDGTNMLVFIPYENIKAITYSPQTSKVYSSFRIYLK